MVVWSAHYGKRVECLFGVHTGRNTAGNVRSLVANHVTEFKHFFTFGPIRKW